MFDIGFLELVVIAVIGLIVIGPERLPDVARTVGKWVGRTRRFVLQVKSDIDREIRQEELRKAIEEDAGLDEIKQIMDTDRFTLEEEKEEDEDKEPEYLVKAVSDEELEQAGNEQAAKDKPDDSNTAAEEQAKEPHDEQKT
jgi:sec-independent protein translocase protein TatB